MKTISSCCTKVNLCLWSVYPFNLSLCVPVLQVGRVAMTVAISACGPPWVFTRLKDTESHSSTARYVPPTEATMLYLSRWRNSFISPSTKKVDHNKVRLHFRHCLSVLFWFKCSEMIRDTVKFIPRSGHLHASCVLRSQRLPWRLCWMAWLAFSCCSAIEAQCHARAPCTTPSTPSLWWVKLRPIHHYYCVKTGYVTKTYMCFFRCLSMPGSGPLCFTLETPISLRFVKLVESPVIRSFIKCFFLH